MNDLLTAFGLMLIFEGVIWALAAGQMASVAALLERTRPDVLRALGLVTALVGLLLVWLVRSV